MDLILYTIKIRLANQFINKVWWRVLLQFLLLVFIAAYAFGFAFIYDKLAEESEFTIQLYFFLGLCGVLAFFTLTRGFFPSYSPRRDPISGQYPVSHRLRFFTNLASELTSSHFLFLLLALLVIFLTSGSFSGAQFAACLSVLFGAHCLRRLLQTNIEKQIARKSGNYSLSVGLGFGAVAAALAGGYFLLNEKPWGIWLITAFMPMLLLADFLADKAIIANKEKNETSFLGSSNLFLSLLLRSKNIRVTLLMALAFKAVFLGIDVASAQFGDGEFSRQSPVILFVVGPLLLFSYIFNNTWGHFRSLWLTADRTGATSWDLAKLQWQLLLYPLLADMIITGIYLCFPSEKQSFFVFFYLGSLAVGLPISIISSIYQPKLILKFQAMRQTTSVAFAFVLMAAAGLMLLPLYNKWLFVGYPVFIGIAVFAAVAVLKEYRQFRHKLYEKLYKAKD